MGGLITTDEFEQLYRNTAPELFGYLRRRTTLDAEDLVAEVFITAWRRRTELPAPELRRAWLFGTARNLLLAESRRRRHGHELVEGFVDVPSRGDPDATALRQAVADALGRLDAAEREIIELVEWERLSPAEAAVALGIRPGTARVRLHRARQSLAADPAFSALAERICTVDR